MLYQAFEALDFAMQLLRARNDVMNDSEFCMDFVHDFAECHYRYYNQRASYDLAIRRSDRTHLWLHGEDAQSGADSEATRQLEGTVNVLDDFIHMSSGADEVRLCILRASILEAVTPSSSNSDRVANAFEVRVRDRTHTHAQITFFDFILHYRPR